MTWIWEEVNVVFHFCMSLIYVIRWKQIKVSAEGRCLLPGLDSQLIKLNIMYPTSFQFDFYAVGFFDSYNIYFY